MTGHRCMTVESTLPWLREITHNSVFSHNTYEKRINLFIAFFFIANAEKTPQTSQTKYKNLHTRNIYIYIIIRMPRISYEVYSPADSVTFYIKHLLRIYMAGT